MCHGRLKIRRAAVRTLHIIWTHSTSCTYLSMKTRGRWPTSFTSSSSTLALHYVSLTGLISRETAGKSIHVPPIIASDKWR